MKIKDQNTDLIPNKYYIEFAEACSKQITNKDCLKYFKRYDPELPRIIKVLGMLRSINPNSILDVGSGRGRALWPMLYTLPNTSFLCVDKNEWRCEVINAVHNGGVKNVQAVCKNILDLTYEDNQFDVVTALEVMEHIPLVSEALYQIMKLAKRFVIITVPSKPDNNPEHVHYFNRKYFINLVKEITVKNITKIQIEYAGNSMIVIIGFKQKNGD
jgi:2-polyprenyl-3-methyl-5-hydroxy-6-metoxy-1,4-benzoquinol methylase